MTDPSLLGPPGPVHYPESDGGPMGKTDWHVRELAALREVLEARYEDATDVYAAGNLLLYYEEGNPKARVAPDVFVVFGVPPGDRRIYKLWEEGRPPDFVMELTSKSTWMEDEGSKKALYRRLGVREYFMFDPLGDYLDPRLQGFRRGDDDWVRIAPEADGRVTSHVLGLRFFAEGDRLHAVDAVTGEPLLRAEELRRRLRDAEAENERLRRRLAKLGSDGDD